MSTLGSYALILGGILSAAASLAHLACIAIGPSAYRYMGAGEQMARAVEAGKTRPTLVTFAIAGILMAWAVYAFAGAGIAPRLPFTKPVLGLIALVYLTRAFGFPLLKPIFPGNSATFWYVSSGICLIIGALYAVGFVTLSAGP